jgi:asparagine synthase (glutamine-hydrolysing)
MCGFAGVFATKQFDRETLGSHLGAMTSAIRHRGPDDEGFWTDVDGNIGLGFRRLAILDLSEHGHQPMQSGSSRFTIAYNGEVFNHLELRRELEGRGHRFRGHSDTEVILAAFEEWGVVRAVERFVGMFAIAAWDAKEHRLSLVRDRLGKKPLFVYARPGMITFGSELKTLMAGPEFDRSLDMDAVSAYLRYLYVPAPATIFRHTRKLLPGHVLTIHDPRDPLPDSTPYWSAVEAATAGIADPFRGSDEEAVDELEKLLTDAVRRRLQSDVPLGALLSGGIDSSAVVGLAQASAAEPVKTCSIGFTQGEYDESAHAARVATHLGTDHTELRMTGEDALAVVPDIPDLFDEPLADPSQIPTYLVCGLARREVTVALTGDGGDEVFGGYNRYLHGSRLIGRVGRIPKPVRSAISAGISGVSPESLGRAYRAVSPVLPAQLQHRLPVEKILKFNELLRRESPAEMYRSLLSAWQHPEQLMADGRTARTRIESMLAAHSTMAPAKWMMLTDQATYLPDDLLAKVDRASMAVSLEARVPILDHRVVEFGWRLPLHMKLRDGETKWALRQVAYRHVPRSLLDRPKMGFSVPIADWLRGPLREWGEDLLFSGSLEQQGALRLAPVRKAWDRLQTGRASSPLGLWAVLILQSWRARWAA